MRVWFVVSTALSARWSDGTRKHTQIHSGGLFDCHSAGSGVLSMNSGSNTASNIRFDRQTMRTATSQHKMGLFVRRRRACQRDFAPLRQTRFIRAQVTTVTEPDKRTKKTTDRFHITRRSAATPPVLFGSLASTQMHHRKIINLRRGCDINVRVCVCEQATEKRPSATQSCCISCLSVQTARRDATRCRAGMK